MPTAPSMGSSPPLPTAPPRSPRTFADLHARLGGVPLERIRCHPAPGSAGEADLLASELAREPTCELVDGTLVEKAMGLYESRLAMILGLFIERFLEDNDLGGVTGEAGLMRLVPGLVRAPDLSFISWERLPNREWPAAKIPDLFPDLAVEVISEGNTVKEMNRKRREYFAAGARLVWFAYPHTRTVVVYTSPTEKRVLTESDTLDGGDVLPGFRLPLGDWFKRAGRQAASR